IADECVTIVRRAKKLNSSLESDTARSCLDLIFIARALERIGSLSLCARPGMGTKTINRPATIKDPRKVERRRGKGTGALQDGQILHSGNATSGNPQVLCKEA
ncbi:MAG TPA: hypothetical protein VE860_04890, partial [Chthoniobacterales bacterium]|nr:hypothetical protein [Chthoniobacterales bacterium]